MMFCDIYIKPARVNDLNEFERRFKGLKRGLTECLMGMKVM